MTRDYLKGSNYNDIYPEDLYEKVKKEKRVKKAKKVLLVGLALATALSAAVAFKKPYNETNANQKTSPAYNTEALAYPGLAASANLQSISTQHNLEKAEKMSVIASSNSISIIGVGDIMLGTNYPSSHLPGKNILGNVEDILKDADITFGNLEGTILNSGGTPKTGENCFAFRMPDNTVDYLKEAGFDALSLANNHSRDFGTVGATNTMNLLDKAGIHYAGLAECSYTIFEKDGVKYGFCAFAPDYSGTMHFADAVKTIKYLDSRCDMVIVSFHVGAEGNACQHITRKTEYFLGENRGDPYHFAREAIDAGADVVFGEGPHVTRAVDIYKNRFIAYSMGNFATYGMFDLSNACGVSPIIKITVDKTGKLLSGKIYSVKLEGKGVPVLDKNNTALKNIIQLTKADVPETQLIIESDGTIKVNK
jgi:hypothetical protein